MSWKRVSDSEAVTVGETDLVDVNGEVVAVVPDGATLIVGSGMAKPAPNQNIDWLPTTEATTVEIHHPLLSDG